MSTGDIAAQRGGSGNLVDVPLEEIRSHRADVVRVDKFILAGFVKKMPGLVSVPKGDACLASQELPLPIGMTISKDQPALLAWLRAVADTVKPQVDADKARVEKAGS